MIRCLIYLWWTLSWWHPGCFKSKITWYYCIMPTKTWECIIGPILPCAENHYIIGNSISLRILPTWLVYHTLSPSHITRSPTKRIPLITEIAGTVCWLVCDAVCIRFRKYAIGSKSYNYGICGLMQRFAAIPFAKCTEALLTCYFADKIDSLKVSYCKFYIIMDVFVHRQFSNIRLTLVGN